MSPEMAFALSVTLRNDALERAERHRLVRKARLQPRPERGPGRGWRRVRLPLVRPWAGEPAV